MEVHNYNTPETGWKWEERVFGISSRHFGRPDHLHWRDALNAVCKEQDSYGWNPRNPPTPIASELFDCVKSYLPEDFAKRLNFYCAIGSAADYWHGVDGFFSIDQFVVTVDLCVTSKNTYKASVIFLKKQGGKELWRVAKQIADYFIEHLNNQKSP